MTLSLGSVIYENAGGTVREWRVEDAIKGAHEESGVYWYDVLTWGDYRMLVRDVDIRNRLHDEECERWSVFDHRHRGAGIVEAEPEDPYGPIDRQLAPRQVKELSFAQIAGEGSRKTVNGFLDHPALVNHGLGGVHGWKAAFVARSPVDGSIVGVVVLSRPAARALDDGTRIEVSRLATRADRPANTASWMLARAARWAEREGYDVIQAYAGFAGNRGTCYDAAGFEVAREEEVSHERDGWNSAESRDGRIHIEAPDGQSWTRRRWEREL